MITQERQSATGLHDPLLGPRDTDPPTLWGLTPMELHDRFWAARGIQIVRVGHEGELFRDAELFLLTAPELLSIFRLGGLIDRLSWLRPKVMWLRLHHTTERPYREVAVVDEDGQFDGFRRLYGGSDARLARVALTSDMQIARLWSESSGPVSGWRSLREFVPRPHRSSAIVRARTYNAESDEETMQYVYDLVKTWGSPSSTVDRARRQHRDIWVDAEAKVDVEAKFIGPAWIGAGRIVEAEETVVGPAVLWDTPQDRPQTGTIDWESLEPGDTYGVKVRRPKPTSWHGVTKRAFDLAFTLTALLFLVPLFPLVALAILIEDGWPVFFGQVRESKGGRPFTCLKFRSMRRDADRIKASLVTSNQVDGPQFYMSDDPRVTRVGRILRRYHLDELPQFLNVLAGDMSIVGPRPSPHKENQYCPPWREARLSVLPGVTGLWQVKRTREPGRDFQEWIKYDIEYVENASIWLDLWIILRTLRNMIRRPKPSGKGAAGPAGATPHDRDTPER